MKGASSVTRLEGSRKLVLYLPTEPKEILVEGIKLYVSSGSTRFNKKQSSMGKLIKPIVLIHIA